MTPVSSSLPLLKRGVVDLIDEKDLARKLERGPVTAHQDDEPLLDGGELYEGQRASPQFNL